MTVLKMPLHQVKESQRSDSFRRLLATNIRGESIRTDDMNSDDMKIEDQGSEYFFLKKIFQGRPSLATDGRLVSSFQNLPEVEVTIVDCGPDGTEITFSEKGRTVRYLDHSDPPRGVECMSMSDLDGVEYLRDLYRQYTFIPAKDLDNV